MEGLTPIFSYVNKLGKTPANVYKELEAEDYEGAVVKAVQPVPLMRDIINILNRLFGFDISNEPNRQRSSQRRPESRRPNYKGGRVMYKKGTEKPIKTYNVFEPKINIDGAASDSKERINPRTGEPYTAIYKR
jgi:hypothetical protein